MDEPKKVPIKEMLESIPSDAGQWYEHGPTHHENIPFGRLAKEAIEEIQRLQTEVEQANYTAEYQTELTIGYKENADRLQTEVDRLDSESVKWCAIAISEAKRVIQLKAKLDEILDTEIDWYDGPLKMRDLKAINEILNGKKESNKET